MRVKVILRLVKFRDTINVELPENSSVACLAENLASIYGDELQALVGDPNKGYRAIVFVNKEIVKHDTRLMDNDEITMFLPAAGG